MILSVDFKIVLLVCGLWPKHKSSLLLNHPDPTGCQRKVKILSPETRRSTIFEPQHISASATSISDHSFLNMPLQVPQVYIFEIKKFQSTPFKTFSVAINSFGMAFLPCFFYHTFLHMMPITPML